MDAWLEVDLRRLITGDGWQSSPFPIYEGIEVRQRYTILEITSFISNYNVKPECGYADIWITGSMVPSSTIPTTIQSAIQSTIQRHRNMQLHAWVSMPNTIPTWPWWFQVTYLQYWNHTCHTRFVFGESTSSKEGDDSAGIATTPTANCCTRSAATNHQETHSSIGTASSSTSTWARSNNCTPRMEKKAYSEVIGNTPTDESRSCMSNHRLSNNIQKGDYCTGIKNNPCCKRLPYPKPWA